MNEPYSPRIAPLSEQQRAEPAPVPIGERLVALLLLALLSPFFLAVAAAVKLESPGGPIFYRQERVGLNRRQDSGDRRVAPASLGPVTRRRDRRSRSAPGRSFSIWKFRTMVPDAEAKSGPVWATKDDPRITRVGRILRSTRLDEMPQLANVLAGDMRLIGPRPERPHFVGELAEDLPDYTRRLRVHPGITGLAQVERSYDGDLEDVRKKLQYDLFYIENRQPILDFKILAKTCVVVLTRRGAR